MWCAIVWKFYVIIRSFMEQHSWFICHSLAATNKNNIICYFAQFIMYDETTRQSMQMLFAAVQFILFLLRRTHLIAERQRNNNDKTAHRTFQVDKSMDLKLITRIPARIFRTCILIRSNCSMRFILRRDKLQQNSTLHSHKHTHTHTSHMTIVRVTNY